MLRLLSCLFFIALSTTCFGSTALLDCDKLPAHIDSLKAAQSPLEAKRLLKRTRIFIDQNACADSLLYKAKSALATTYFDLGQFDEVLALTDSLSQFKITSANSAYIIRLYSTRANALARVNKLQEALFTSARAMELSAENDSVFYYKFLMNRGIMLSLIGDYAGALESYLYGLDHFRRMDDKQTIAILYNNLGEMYRQAMGEPEKAFSMYRNAIRLNVELENDFHLAKNYNNIGIAYSDRNAEDSAQFYLKKSIMLNQKIGNTYGEVKARYNLANSYKRIKDLPKSEALYGQCYTISQKTHNPTGVYYALLGLSRVATEKGKTEAATAFLQNADSVASGSMDWEMRKGYLDVEREILKKQGKFKEALAHYESYHKEVDSVNSFNNEQTTLYLKAEYESTLDEMEKEYLMEQNEETKRSLGRERERNTLYLIGASVVFVLLVIAVVLFMQKQKALHKEKQLAAKVSEQNHVLSDTQNQLSVQLEMKNKILSVLGHDLRAPFASIAGLLNAMSQGAFSQEEAKPMVKQLSLEVEQTLTTLSNILLWSRLQLSEGVISKEVLDFGDIAETAIAHVNPAAEAKRIKLGLTYDKGAKILADPNQIRSILNNLLNNAIKFSEYEGAVELQLQRERNFDIIKVIDEGTGLSAKALDSLNAKKTYTKEGTAGEKGTGIGLSLVRDFAGLHGGSLHFYGNEPKGTVVEVKIPRTEVNES